MFKIKESLGNDPHLVELLGSLQVPPEIDEPELVAQKNISKATYRYDMLSLQDIKTFDQFQTYYYLFEDKLLKLERQRRANVIIMFNNFLLQKVKYRLFETVLSIEVNWIEFLDFMKFVCFDNEQFLIQIWSQLLSVSFPIKEEDVDEIIEKNWFAIDKVITKHKSTNIFVEQFLKYAPYKSLNKWLSIFTRKNLQMINAIYQRTNTKEKS